MRDGGRRISCTTLVTPDLHRHSRWRGCLCFKLPDEIPFEHGAIMMCSSATSLHALNKARMKPGESVAIFGAGGLGISAIQLAKALGAREVFAVDIQPNKLDLARSLGAVPIDARADDPVKLIRDHTGGRGVDVALELIGLPLTMQQSVRSLAKQGRAALVGITERNFEVSPYHELVNREAKSLACPIILPRRFRCCWNSRALGN